MGATDYFEMPNSPTESYNAREGTMSATRIFKCAWEDRYTVRDYLFGYPAQQYEYYDDMWAVNCAIAPFTTPPIAESALNKKAVYKVAILTVQYETITGYPAEQGESNLTGAEFCSQNITLETQILNVTSGQLWWNEAKTSAVDDGESPEKLVPFKRYNITFHAVATIPAAFDSLAGTVNIAAYVTVKGKDDETTTSAAGTMLYHGYSMQRSLTGFGTAGWDITLSFTENINGWNYAWNPNTQAWSRVYDDAGDAIDLYTLADWTTIGLPPKKVYT